MRWFIDGHNLIGQMPTIHLNDPDDEEKLLEHLRRYRARTGHQLTVVFDAGQSYQLAETKKRGGITVQFAAHGQSADQIIIRRVRKAKNPQAVGVVTSDRAIQQVARQARVRVITSQEFSQQLLKLAAGPQSKKGKSNQADIRLSAAEVEEWLDIFQQPKDE